MDFQGMQVRGHNGELSQEPKATFFTRGLQEPSAVFDLSSL